MPPSPSASTRSAGWQKTGTCSPGAAPRWSAWAWPSTIRLRPPSEQAAADRPATIALIPASNIVTPPLRVLDQVDVHRLQREAAADEPDALGDALGVVAQRAPLELRLAVEGARHALLGGRARRRQHPDLAREGGAVGVGVLAHDLAVAQVEEVEPGEVEPREGRLDALERRRAGERALARPVHGDLVAVGDDVLHLEAQVGHGAEELGPVGAHAVGPGGLAPPTRGMTPSGAQAAAIASRSCSASASK